MKRCTNLENKIGKQNVNIVFSLYLYLYYTYLPMRHPPVLLSPITCTRVLMNLSTNCPLFIDLVCWQVSRSTPWPQVTPRTCPLTVVSWTCKHNNASPSLEVLYQYLTRLFCRMSVRFNGGVVVEGRKPLIVISHLWVLAARKKKLWWIKCRVNKENKVMEKSIKERRIALDAVLIKV